MTSTLFVIAVTGAAGHVGAAVAQHALDQGHTVVALDRTPTGRIPPQDRYTYKQCDAKDFEVFKAACEGCTALIHLAAVFNHPNGLKSDEILQHDVHNINVTMSFNALSVATALGIDRVVLASSVNSIGMVFSKRPQFDYVPVDENHAFRPEDAYSLSKYFCELQSDAAVRRCSSLRVATLRFHWVVPTTKVGRESLHENGGTANDLWGWVSLNAAADACIRALTAPTSVFPVGHETFFIVARTIIRQANSLALLREVFPEVKDIRGKIEGNASLIDTSKAERMLGWKEDGFPWNG